MNADRINELYNGQIFDTETQKAARERIHWICSQVKGNKVVDIGCSQGITTLLLGREGFNCVGVDYEQIAIEYALKELEKEEFLVRQRIIFKLADATSLPFEDGYFETAIMGEILEHLTQPEKILAEAQRVLVPNGRVVITVPLGLNDSPDHKATYYPRNLLEKVENFFQTETIDILNNNIVYVGCNAAPGNRKKTDANDLDRLYQSVEKRCFTHELKVQEIVKKQAEQNLKHKSEISALAEKTKTFESELAEKSLELTAALAEQQSKFSEISAAKDLALEHEKKACNVKVKNLEENLAGRLQELEKALAAKDVEINETLAARGQELAAMEQAYSQAVAAKEMEFQSRLIEKEEQLKEKLESKDLEIQEIRVNLHEVLRAMENEARDELARKDKDLAEKEAEFEILLAEKERQGNEQLAARTREWQEAKNNFVVALAVKDAEIDELLTIASEMETSGAGLPEALAQRDTLIDELKATLAGKEQEFEAALVTKETEIIELIAGTARDAEMARQAHNAQLAECHEQYNQSLGLKEQEFNQVLAQEVTDLQGRKAELNKLLAAKEIELQGLRDQAARELLAKEQELNKALAAKDVELQGLRDKVAQELLAKEQELKKTLAAKEIDLQELRTFSSRELATKVQELQTALATVQSELEKKLEDKEREHRAALDNKRRELSLALEAQEDHFRSAYTWRFGWTFTGLLTLLQEFSRNPYKFSRNIDKHLINYHRNIFPAPAEKIASFQTPCYLVTSSPSKGVVPDQGKITLGGILDEFTTDCFKPESNLITFRPDNWKETVEKTRPDAFFVESAWRGNDGAWLYRVAKYQRNMGDELSDLLTWAKEHGVPSIFWNKEDPVHFERFVERAALFDHVFTSDADCVPAYCKQLGHDRVYALPFAAQPALHNPILDGPRNKGVCFAGTYYGDRHETRRNDMDHLLRPSIPFGLEIYDRQHGLTGKQAELYRFPDIYQPCIKGRLDYDEMVKAYRQYKVFLNVNSVKESPTMFSRRVFELLACGTPVVSTYSRGIVELLGADVVFISESEAETQKHLEHLLNDENAWHRASVRGIRKVMEAHTYADRLKFMMDKVGIALPAKALPSIAVVARVEGKGIDALAETLRRQICRPASVLAVSEKPLASRELERLQNSLGNIQVLTAPLTAAVACRQAAALDNQYLAFLDARDGYGAHYLSDLALAAMYSGGAEIFGKHAFFTSHDKDRKTKLQGAGQEFRKVSSVASASLCVRKDIVTEELVRHAFSSRTFKAQEQQIISLDRFNYLQAANGANAKTDLLSSIEV